MSAVEAIQMLPELNQDLRACATEADLVQVLYGYLNPRFGYDIINMHVLEHEGWYHSVIVERGVLQDVIRRRIAESDYGHLYDHPRSAVVDTGPGSSFSYVHSRGPGNRRQPQRAIWMPITYLGQAIGAVIYQIYEEREVPASELDLLEKIHAPLGVLVHNAYLNALTRDQAISFSALNAIARALSATREERDVTAALYSALGQLLPLEQLDLALLDEHRPDRARLLTVPATGMPRMVELSRRSRRLAGLHPTLRQGKPQLDVHGTVACAPLLEGGRRRGALIIRADQIGAYERSTLAFLEQVAHEVVLALRNAWSYAALEAQRRRLAVVNTVGRKLASSLDLPSIQRTLREELARHLAFDVFSLVTVEETEAGPVATAYVYDSGQDQVLPAVPLGQAGPSRQAYETARPVLIRRSPWAHSLEQQRQPSQQEVRGDQALLVVTRPRLEGESPRGP